MIIRKSKINAFLLSFLVIFFCSFDGILYHLNINSNSGGLNLYMAFLYIGLLTLFYIFNFSKTIGLIKLKDNVKVIVLALMLIAVFLIVSVFTEFKVKLLRDISYVFLYMMLFLLFNSTNKYQFNNETFIKTVILSIILLLPLLSVILGSNVFPRFEGIYGTPSLTGNTVAFAVSMVILNWKKYFSPTVGLVLIIFSIVIIVLSGSRTALTIVVFAFIFKFLSSRSLLNSITNVLILLIFTTFFSAVNLGNLEAFNELRVLSVDDIQIGSISTRLIWLTKVLDSLSQSSWVGGFGSGASEELLGVIMHADILQIYFDYSFLALIIYLLLIYLFSGTRKEKFFVFYFLSLFLLGLQNAFYAPIIIMLYLSLRITTTKKYEN